MKTYKLERADLAPRRAASRRRIGERLLLVGVVTLPLAVGFLAQAQGCSMLWLLLLVPLALAGLALYKSSAATALFEDGTLEVDERGWIARSGSDSWRWGLEALETGWPRGEDGAVVRLRGGTELAITGLGEGEGVELLERLRLDPTRCPASFKVRGALSNTWMGSSGGRVFGVLGLTILPPFTGLMLILVGALAAVVFNPVSDSDSQWMLVAWLVVAAVTAALIFASRGIWRYLLRRTVTVGIDGLDISGGWGRRFIGLSTVTAVKETWGEVLLRGEDDRLAPLNPTPHLHGPSGDSGLAARIRWAMESQPSSDKEVLAETLGRRGADVSAWREDLLAMARRKEAYRDAALEPEQLLELAADPAAPADVRVGSVVVAAAMGGEQTDARIGRIAAVCANWHLRQALLKAARMKIDPKLVQQAAALAGAEFPKPTL